MTRLSIPYQHTENPAPISQHRRIALIRRAVTDDAVPLRARVVTLLMLLYAQPVSRIMRLITDDVIHDGDQVLLRLGTPPSPVPEPFAGLLLKHLAGRENTTTATNPNGTWLFPGRRAGQPLHPATLGTQLSTLGIATLHARTAKIRQLVLQAPPSVVAGMLGYHVVHTEAVAVQAGGTWKHYAPGDHTRSLPRVPSREHRLLEYRSLPVLTPPITSTVAATAERCSPSARPRRRKPAVSWAGHPGEVIWVELALHATG